MESVLSEIGKDRVERAIGFDLAVDFLVSEGSSFEFFFFGSIGVIS